MYTMYVYMCICIVYLITIMSRITNSKWWYLLLYMPYAHRPPLGGRGQKSGHIWGDIAI